MLNNDFIIHKKTYFIILFVLLVFITLLLRLPFLSDNINFNNDASVYSKNIKHDFFNGKYRVQMPGYILYIYLGRLFYIFIKNTVLIQHIINMIMSLLISLSFFYLLKKINFSNNESFLYTILFSFNNILMLGSLTGGNRLFLTFGSIVLIYIAIDIILNEKKNSIIIFTILFSVIIGFRQDFSFYFIFLYIYLLFNIKNLKLTVLSLFLFAVINISWFIPLMLEYEGIKGYLLKMDKAEAIKGTSIFFSKSLISPLLNIVRIFIYIFNTFLFIIPIFILTLIKKQFNIPKKILIILILSFFPSLIFQMLVHNGNFVQLAAFMTPLFIFLIYNFRLNNKLKFGIVILLILLCIFQFFGLRMFKEKTFNKQLANVLWLQYTYDGVKSGMTLRLQDITENNNEKNDQ